MFMRIPGVLSLILVFGGAASADSAPSPYAGQEHGEIKALSPDEMKNYQSGKGMGLAKAAELNHYPGPAHVLELAQQLKLTPGQRARTQALFQNMEADAVRLGRAVIEQERILDELFATQAITREQLQSALETISGLQGRLRRAHLEAHLVQKDILTPEQVRRYDALRGYHTSGGPGGSHSHAH